MDLTSRLGLQKPNPDPVTGDFVDIAVLNSNMDKIDGVINAVICTSGTRPATPFDGQLIRETDTRRMYIWNATQSAWDQIALANPSRLLTSMDVQRASTGVPFYNGYVASEGNPRFTVAGNGEIGWGPGSSAVDTTFGRSAANMLSTGADDQLIVRGGTHRLLTYSDVSICDTTLPLTSSMQDLSGTTVNFTTYRDNAKVSFLWTNDFELTAASGTGILAIGIVSVDGSDQTPNSLWRPGNVTSARGSVNQFHDMVVATAGPHSAKLRSRLASTATTGAQVRNTHTMLRVQVFE